MTQVKVVLPPRVPTGAAGAVAVPSAAPPSHRDVPLLDAHRTLHRARGAVLVTRPSSGEAVEPNGDGGKRRVTRNSRETEDAPLTESETL